jgi:hypothetical protein
LKFTSSNSKSNNTINIVAISLYVKANIQRISLIGNAKIIPIPVKILGFLNVIEIVIIVKNNVSGKGES